MEKTALIFPGQGSHYVGMGKYLYDNYDVAKKIFNEANEALEYDITKTCFEGPLAELSRIDVMLPAILTVSVASFYVLQREYGIEPDYLAGHSLGEYSALTCSGAIKFYDAVKLVRKRSQLAIEHFKEKDVSMSIIENIDFTLLEDYCNTNTRNNELVTIACINGKSQFTICGDNEAVIKVEDAIALKDGIITPLIYGLPFHSSLMDTVSKKLCSYIKDITFLPFKYPVLSNVDANIYMNESEIVDRLINQIKKPVQWYSIVSFLEKYNVKNIIEVGPQKILGNIIGKDFKSFNLYAFNNIEDHQKIKQIVNNDTFNDKKNYHKSIIEFIEMCLGEAVATKNYCYDDKLYEVNVIDKYIEMESLLKDVEENLHLDDKLLLEKILINLKSIFDTKGVKHEEQYDRFNYLLSNSIIKEKCKSYVDQLLDKTIIIN